MTEHKGGEKIRRQIILVTLTLLFIVLVCNAVSAAEISDNSTLQTKYQAVNQSNNSSVDNSTNTSDQPSTVVISGEVKRCSNGDPFQGVTVTVSKDGTELASTTTDENGAYYLSFLSNAGVFNVTASYPGHNSSTKEVLVGSTENNTLYGTADFKLGQFMVYVSPNGDDGDAGDMDNPYRTIGKALNEVMENGYIELYGGTYSGTGNVGLTITKGVHIEKADTGTVVIDGVGITNPIFTVNGANINVVIIGMTFTGGNNGAICQYMVAKTLNVSYCTFTNNHAGYGGAIEADGNSLNLYKCTFTGNTADVGGAINVFTTCTVKNCTFNDNSASEGGAIWNIGNTWVTNSTFSGNKATNSNWGYGGGAIGNSYGLYLTDCTFTNNTASYDGAAIWNMFYTSVTNCTFTENNAESGAIWNRWSSTFTITGSNFTNNTAAYGSAIENYGTMTIDTSNFTNNTATNGGAISYLGENLTITNSNFTNNTATNGGAIWTNYNPTYPYNGPFNMTSCIFTGNTATQGSVIWNSRGSDTGLMHFNRIFGNTGNYDVYSASGTVNAENNWWGDNFNGTNPTTAGRVNSDVDADPWIVLRLSASPTLIGPGGTSIVTADLSKNSNGTTLSGTLPDGTIHFSTNNNGKLSPYDETIGCNSIVTKFTAANVPYTAQISSELDGFSVSTSIDVKLGTSLTVNEASGYKGDNTNLTATLWMGNRPGSNAIVNFYVNGVYVGCGTTDANGVARYTYSIIQNVGTYTIDATFNTTTQYTASTGTNTLTVDATPTNLTVGTASGYKGDSTTLTATLWDTAHNTAVAGEKIDFYLNSVYVGCGITNNMGIATCDYNITQDVGTSTINATFNATTQYEPGKSTNVLTVNVIPTSLTVNGTSGYKGDSTTLTATLWDTAHNKAVAGEKIDFYVNGDYVCQGTTDSNGLATCNYNITQDVGTYTINATFNATTQYTSSNGANILTVNATPTNLTVDDVTGNNGANVTLKATLTDTAHNVGISGKTVTFKVNGIIVGNATTDANGVTNLLYYNNLVGGTYAVDAEFNADTQYAGFNNAGTLKVPQSSIYVVVTTSNKNPHVGETFTLTYKLGNNGPDDATNVTITIPLPEGFELTGIRGDGIWNYNPTTRTITWTMANLTVGDPYLYITGKTSEAGSYLFSSSITSDTYDVNREGVTPITINVANNTTDTKTQVNAASNTVTMQNTGIPVNYLVLAILAIISGFIAQKRK